MKIGAKIAHFAPARDDDVQDRDDDDEQDQQPDRADVGPLQQSPIFTATTVGMLLKLK